ncbi:MAG: methyltransferase domain-containing protein [Deltaproteobacteria bacterium]|nr:methyltransferase domain-containing protein [Deltaproteobacteria bacterium]
MLEGAIRWIRRHVLASGGIAVSSQQRVAYPEVTGYYVPTLLALGERDLARAFSDWLVAVQRGDGSFGGPGMDESFAFDTGQVVRGWVAMLPTHPALERPLRRACDWLVASGDAATGRLAAPAPGAAWSLGPRGEVSEAIHLYALAPLAAAGDLLGEARYRRFAERGRDWHLRHLECTRFEAPHHLTHFYAYVQEALVELGCHDEARRGMADVARWQQENGAIPAYSDVPWVCATGIAQLAQVWFRLGEPARAERALAFLAALQNPGGGFFGSYGVGAAYFPDQEPSWGVKYAIEAEQCRIASHFDATVGEYRPDIAEHDGRVRAVLAAFGDLGAKRVLDAGAGKGRYAALVKRTHPSAEVTALDVSAEMLRHVPPGIATVQHSLLDMPFPDGRFDAVLCVEALEHAVRIPEAVRELVRVLAPGGTLVVIDKNKAKLGALAMPSWERWFDAGELTTLLSSLGLDVEAASVGYDGRAADGLFLCWTARKPRTVHSSTPCDVAVGAAL